MSFYVIEGQFGPNGAINSTGSYGYCILNIVISVSYWLLVKFHYL